MRDDGTSSRGFAGRRWCMPECQLTFTLVLQDFERICGESHEYKGRKQEDDSSKLLSLVAVAAAAFAIGLALAR